MSLVSDFKREKLFPPVHKLPTSDRRTQRAVGMNLHTLEEKMCYHTPWTRIITPSLGSGSSY